MKLTRIFLILFVFALFAGPAFAGNTVSDKVEGSEIKTFWLVSDGTWQALELPSTISDVRHVAIQVHNGTASEYTHIDNEIEFQISSESDGTGWFYASNIVLSIGKTAGATICYIKAATGQKIAVLGLR